MRVKILTIAAALVLSAPLLAEVPLDPGSTATVRLSPQGSLAYPIQPAPPHAPANFGAILSIDIDEPGRYHVAIGAPGRVDISRDGQPIVSLGQQDGAPGSGIARVLDFDLPAGHYSVALSGMTAGAVSVSVSR